MNKWKKVLGVALCAAMVTAAFAGCAKKSEETAEPTETTEVEEVEQRTVYVTPAWVNAAVKGDIGGYEDVQVYEVTYSGAWKDSKDYQKGHVPGAYLIGDTDIEDAEGTVDAPYNLLSADTIKENLLKRGITKDTKVVLYGADAAGVGRVAYGMIYEGVEDVKIMNGGLEAWKNTGFDTESEKKEHKPEAATDFGTAVPAHPEYWTSMQDAASRLQNDSNFKLVSVRSEEEWLGKSSGYSYIDRAGEPEGAVWGKGADTAFDVNGYLKDGKVIDLETLKKTTWKDVDFTTDNFLSFYCGTGWRATVPFLIMYQEGMDNMSVYDGGWYEWQMHDEMPVQVGDPAKDSCKHVTVAELPTDKAAKN